MKALQKFADGKEGMAIREVPEPTIGPTDLLIEVAAVGICGSDLHIWRDEKEHLRPVTLGHEYSGVVIDRGDHVDALLGLVSGPSTPDHQHVLHEPILCEVQYSKLLCHKALLDGLE